MWGESSVLLSHIIAVYTFKILFKYLNLNILHIHLGGIGLKKFHDNKFIPFFCQLYKSEVILVQNFDILPIIKNGFVFLVFA